MESDAHTPAARPSAREVFLVFLKLGCSSFGGPVAHLGYFRSEFVLKRQWIDEESYADLVALCQFLPGPASSQVGLALGRRRCGWPGALAAWLGFTLPSAVLMIGLALGFRAFGFRSSSGWIQGLQVAAVAVVGLAVVQMGRKLCATVPTAAIAAAAVFLLVAFQAGWAAPVVIALGAVAGGIFIQATSSPSGPANDPRSGWTGWACLWAFLGLALVLPLLAAAIQTPALEVADAFYRCGALVFGGGHVVLPLLDRATVARGWISEEAFLAGYGAAQALPGPLFAFSAYLGTLIAPGGVGGGLLGLVCLYLPGALILFAALPLWDRLRHVGKARAWLAGANAAVVGLLAAALAGPIGWAVLIDVRHLLLVFAAFGLLWTGKVPSWMLAALCALAGMILF